MHLVTLPAQDKAFLVLLNQHPELDGRDPRGCRHSVALVLMGVLMALCSGRDANLSSIQRYMKSRFDGLCRRIGHQATQVVSRAQLPRLLAQVNQPVFAHLVQAHYGLQLTDEFSGWLSGNGKELRGSILKGKHRGDACVSIITQADQSIVAQAHYNGTKDSERPSVSNLLNINGLLNRKIVLDALHLTADLLESIDHHKGSYLIGFKSNQPHLFRLCFVQIMTPASSGSMPPNGSMHVSKNAPMRAFQSAHCQWLIARRRLSCTPASVQRIRRTLAGVQLSQTESFYVTNEQATSAQQAYELYDAIRGHWRI